MKHLMKTTVAALLAVCFAITLVGCALQRRDAEPASEQEQATPALPTADREEPAITVLPTADPKEPETTPEPAISAEDAAIIAQFKEMAAQIDGAYHEQDTGYWYKDDSYYACLLDPYAEGAYFYNTHLGELNGVHIIDAMDGYYLIGYIEPDNYNAGNELVCIRDGKMRIANDADGMAMKAFLMKKAIYGCLESVEPGCSRTRKLNETDVLYYYRNLEWLSGKVLSSGGFYSRIVFMWQEESGDAKVAVYYENGLDEEVPVKSSRFRVSENETIYLDETIDEAFTVPAHSGTVRVFTIPAERVLTGTEKWGHPWSGGVNINGAYSSDMDGMRAPYYALLSAAQSAKYSDDYEAFRALFVDTDESIIEMYYATDWTGSILADAVGPENGYYWGFGSFYTVDGTYPDTQMNSIDHSDGFKLVNGRLRFVINNESAAAASVLMERTIQEQCPQLLEKGMINRVTFYDKNYMWLDSRHSTYNDTNMAKLLYLGQRQNGDVIAAVWFVNGTDKGQVAEKIQIRVTDDALGEVFDYITYEQIENSAYGSQVCFITIPAGAVETGKQQWTDLYASVDVNYHEN